jgi:serine/threonine protein phosphatase PrpC
VAAVSDRGLHRQHNDDYYAIEAVDGRLLAVVCDGVASTDDAGPTAAAAAWAAMERLTAGAPATDWSALAQEAVARAQEAVLPAAELSGDADGSTTLTLALVRPGEVVVANVGDSRAYWLGDDGRNLLLSVDDSWQNFATAAGFPESVARDPSRLHEITAWLGPDAEMVAPHVVRHSPDGGGLVVLCSDGLWNYVEPPDSLGALVGKSADRRPASVARHLVQAAIDAGGADNVTVVVLAIPQWPETIPEKRGAGHDHV